MNLEIGIVCARCDAYASMGTARCPTCGNDLALADPDERGPATEASFPAPAAAALPSPDSEPPTLARASALEAPGVDSEPPTLARAPSIDTTARGAIPDAPPVSEDAPKTDRTPSMVPPPPAPVHAPSPPTPRGVGSMEARIAAAEQRMAAEEAEVAAAKEPTAAAAGVLPKKPTREFQVKKTDTVDSLGAVLNESLRPRTARTPFPRRIVEAKVRSPRPDPREEPQPPAAPDRNKKLSSAGAARLSLEELMDQAKHFVCKSCSTPVPMGHKFCGRCGAGVPPEILATRTQFFGQLQSPGKAKLILIRGEGVEGLSYQLNAENHLVGRQGQLVFPDDPFVSPRHANLFYRDGKLVVKDEGSLNGVFVRVRGTIDISPGDHFLAGEQLFRIDATPKATDGPGADGTYFYSSPKHQTPFRIVQILHGGPTGMTVCARSAGVQIGREGGDLNFPTDLYMSASHCKVEEAAGKLQLTDLNSRNGTFVRLHAERELSHGDYLFIGKKLLRVEITAA